MHCRRSICAAKMLICYGGKVQLTYSQKGLALHCLGIMLPHCGQADRLTGCFAMHLMSQLHAQVCMHAVLYLFARCAHCHPKLHCRKHSHWG
jgi:hypothetical protein